jgi:ABC-type spermidine/putrescine transport system permease subunit I
MLFLFIFLLFSANGKELAINIILIMPFVFLFLLFFIYIEMGITDTDIIKERFNTSLDYSSLFHISLFYFVIIESAMFGYKGSYGCIIIGNKRKYFK